MKEEIIKKLTNVTKSQSINEIFALLNLKTVEDQIELENVIRKLIAAGKLHETKKHKFLLMENCQSLKSGPIRINKFGNGYIDISNQEPVFINKNNLNNAINNDVVIADCFLNHGLLEGKVIKILQRKLDNIVGEIISVHHKLIFKPDDDKLKINIDLTKESIEKCVEGYKVVIKIIKDYGRNHYLAEITKIIGHKNDPDVDIIAIAIGHDIPVEFSDLIKKELETIPTEVTEAELVNRTNLTAKEIFTIDGADTKDIDDAISLEKIGEIYRLGVHIADVSHYVKMGSAIYEEAFQRGTSSYLADKVIPMIPHKLSNGICSLNPQTIRLTISCVMDINTHGEVVKYDIFPSYIKSRKKMTYEEVNQILLDNEVPSGYEDYKDTLILMNELACILRKYKEKRGFIDFDIAEAKIIQDENGKAIDIVKSEQKAGENLIEDFMIAANETVATHIAQLDLPFIYRIHDLPSNENIMEFINTLKAFGYVIKINLNKITPLTIQNILKELANKKDYNILTSLLLKSMKKACYSTDNIGHFGLASPKYTHFTSPIRRFPDLTVHRLLRTYVFNKDRTKETIIFNQKYLPKVAARSSEREVASQEAENDVLDMKMAEYMLDKIGNVYYGTIINITSFGFFVQLDNLIEGLVHINTLNGYFTYKPQLLSLVNENNGVKYKLGDEIKVRVSEVSKEKATIDFEIYDGK